jgi:hypothetical protein
MAQGVSALEDFSDPEHGGSKLLRNVNYATTTRRHTVADLNLRLHAYLTNLKLEKYLSIYIRNNFNFRTNQRIKNSYGKIKNGMA